MSTQSLQVLAGCALFYLAVVALWPSLLGPSLAMYIILLYKILPLFALVFAIMVAVTYYVTPGRVVKALGHAAGRKRWILSGFFGIASVGPPYIWFPLLRELKKSGITNGIVSVFLYNRAIKPAFLPILIAYFGVAFTAVLTLVLFLASLVQGWIIDSLLS